MPKATVLILAAASFAIAQQRDSAGARPPLVYELSNGGPGFPSHEKVTLTADGSVVYETIGPLTFAGLTQNRVGEFATRVDAAVYAKLAQELTRAVSNGQTTFPPDSVIERIALDTKGGASLSRVAGAPSPAFDALAKQIASLEAAARPHPVRALELSCAKQPENLVCRVQSVGSSPLVAPDLPHGQFFCFDHERHMQGVVRPAGLSEGQKTLAPGQAIELRFPPSACEFRVVIEARGAILVSNSLAP